MCLARARCVVPLPRTDAVVCLLSVQTSTIAMRLDATGSYLSHHLMHMRSTEETRGAEENTVLIDFGRRAAADCRMDCCRLDLHTMAADRRTLAGKKRGKQHAGGRRGESQMDGLGAD